MLEVIEAPEVRDIITLPPAARAALLLNSTQTAEDLKQLATSLKAITLVNSLAGREQAHALAMTARSARIAIEKAGKAARDDATKFSKAVIAEEDRLIEIIQPEETRVLGLRNAWDAAEQARKEAEAWAERERIERHQAVIAQIRSYPGLAHECRTSEMVTALIEKLYAVPIASLEEFKDAASAARILSGETMRSIRDAKAAHEAEQARIKAEQQAEASRLSEQARVQAEQQAELIAMQARMKAQQEELDRQAAAMAQQAAELEARKAEAAKPAPVLADDPCELLAQIIPAEMLAQLAQVIPMETLVQLVPEANEAAPLPTPPAIDLAVDLAVVWGVDHATALRWLAERADEFKTLHAESNK
jgi:hypothetical protein